MYWGFIPVAAFRVRVHDARGPARFHVRGPVTGVPQRAGPCLACSLEKRPTIVPRARLPSVFPPPDWAEEYLTRDLTA